MAFYSGTFSVGSNGNTSITGVGFQPSYLRFTISQKGGATDNTCHISNGFTDGTRQYVACTMWDSSGGRTTDTTARCINHLARVSGTISDVVKATFVSFDADGFTLNFTANDSNYVIGVEAFA